MGGPDGWEQREASPSRVGAASGHQRAPVARNWRLAPPSPWLSRFKQNLPSFLFFLGPSP